MSTPSGPGILPGTSQQSSLPIPHPAPQDSCRFGEWCARFGAFVLGCTALVVWFLFQQEAWRQFTANIELQKSFYQNWNSVMAGLSNYRLQGGVLLWSAGLISSALLITGWPSGTNKNLSSIGPAWRILAPSLFIAVIIIHTLTRCENFSYLAIGTPFATMLVCVATTKSADALPQFIRWLPMAALLMLAAIHASLHPYRLFQFIKADMPDLDVSYAKVLREIPQDRTVFIPHPMWPAAACDTSHTIRWFTFPIASSKATRGRYEHQAYAAAKPGDVLIIDNGGAGQPDRFGLYPTFSTNPPDPAKWSHIRDHKQLFTGATTWGIDLSVYEFRNDN